MKAVLVHSSAKAIEKDWSNQYAGLDAAVKKEFETVADFDQRVAKVFFIKALTWPGIIAGVTEAAAAAGTGGTVVVASGHGGAGGDPSLGIINWDATDSDVARGWEAEKDMNKGLFWDEVTMQYIDPRPATSTDKTRKAEDERKISENPNNKLARGRLDAFDGLTKIAAVLKANGIARLSFTVCTAGKAKVFMNRMAGHLGCEVACYNEPPAVFDDGTLGFRPGKARLILDSDSGPEKDPLTPSTNRSRARCIAPNLDSSLIAFVGKPAKPATP